MRVLGDLPAVAGEARSRCQDEVREVRRLRSPERMQWRWRSVHLTSALLLRFRPVGATGSVGARIRAISRADIGQLFSAITSICVLNPLICKAHQRTWIVTNGPPFATLCSMTAQSLKTPRRGSRFTCDCQKDGLREAYRQSRATKADLAGCR